jgi:outer membrane protein OmpA-like peptidoglycan-associated protein
VHDGEVNRLIGLALIVLGCSGAQLAARHGPPGDTAGRDASPATRPAGPSPEPGEEQGFESWLAEHPDRDGDGIPDVVDRCPDEPEDKDGFEDKDGCPDPDNDQDKILDVNDKCPNEPETYNGTEDEDGCPEKGFGPRRPLQILDKLYFARGRAETKPVSEPLLDMIAATIKSRPEVQRVVVEGHADRGEPDRIADARAAAVVNALVARGVDRQVLVARGRGKSQPICGVGEKSSSSRFCPAANRRVEFLVDPPP